VRLSALVPYGSSRSSPAPFSPLRFCPCLFRAFRPRFLVWTFRLRFCVVRFHRCKLGLLSSLLFGPDIWESEKINYPTIPFCAIAIMQCALEFSGFEGSIFLVFVCRCL
jgi:hypothetical protein